MRVADLTGTIHTGFALKRLTARAITTGFGICEHITATMVYSIIWMTAIFMRIAATNLAGVSGSVTVLAQIRVASGYPLVFYASHAVAFIANNTATAFLGVRVIAEAVTASFIRLAY